MSEEEVQKEMSIGNFGNGAHLLYFAISHSQPPVNVVHQFTRRCDSPVFIRQGALPPVFLPGCRGGGWVSWRLQESLAPSYPRSRRPGGAAAQIGNHLVWVDWILAADAKRKLQRHPGRPVVNLVSDPDWWHWIYFSRKRRSWFILNCADRYRGEKTSDTLSHFWRRLQGWTLKVEQILCNETRQQHIDQHCLT